MNLFKMTSPELPKWDKPLKVGEWFSGYGSQMLALKQLGIKIESSYIIK